jgi:hypothetical protein
MTPMNEEYVHKAAVALNNNGVTMLKRHCYREAMDSFKNSFELLKVCLNAELRCESIPQKINSSLNNSSGNISRALQRASCHKKNDFQLDVLSYDPYRDLHALETAAATDESESTGYAIIISIDESDLNIKAQYYTTSIQTQCAIVLNNMTTACMAFAYRSPCEKDRFENNKKRIQLYQKGLELGTTAYDVLSRQLNGERDYTTYRYQCALTILALKNLSRISFQLDNIQLSRDFYVKYNNIRDDAEYIEKNYIADVFQSFLAPVA